MKVIELEFQGKTHRIPVERMGSTLWFHFEGKTYTYETKAKSRDSTAGNSGHPGEVKAPMPGKVIQVKTSIGDRVGQNQVLVVMEAMKMEYTLKSDVDGLVQSVNCAEGEQVSLGQILVKVEAHESL